MQVISLLHFIMRWLLVLVGAGAWLWLVAMLLALLGWTMWTANHVYARVRGSIGSPGKPGRGSVAHQPVPALHDPLFQMLPLP